MKIVAIKIAALTLMAFLQQGCVANSSRQPGWNLPENHQIEILSISYAGQGIGDVNVAVQNNSINHYCVTSEVYRGGPSRLIVSDLITAEGNVIEYENVDAFFKEDETIQRWAPNSVTEITLKYAGQYQGLAPVGVPLKFRVVIPAQICSNDEVLHFSPNIVLVSEFVDVKF
ncbi:hypothetical protein [Asticcacaulis sp. AC402]|uniref:hypothetical protein n=1 Tax=Asticcacaulis sp. AC402 TaxID=1282361 RepID=UPI0012DD134B|nr:hypothetical protein [Asticcacaulis sp. AC402]